MPSKELENTVLRAVKLAKDRRHDFVTLEHLLLALTEDPDASLVIRACAVDLDKLREDLITYLDHDLAYLITDSLAEPQVTESFNRALQRAVIHVQSSSREKVTGANVLVAIYAERESNAIYYLQEQDMTRFDAVNYISRGIAKDPKYTVSREEEEDNSASQKRGWWLSATNKGGYPPVPEQSAGTKYYIAESGLIDFSPAAAGYDEGRVAKLLPQLIEAAQELIDSLKVTDAFANIHATAQEYLETIDRPAQDVRYARVWGLGLKLQKMTDAAAREGIDRIHPSLEDDQKAALDFLLALHAPFVLSTQDGQELHEAVQDYNRTPEKREEYRELVVDLSNAIQKSSGLVTEAVKTDVREATEDFGTGPSPEKELATSENTVRNLLVASAVVAASLTASTTSVSVIQETQASKEFIEFAVTNLDAAYGLCKVATAFLIENETVLRALAASFSDNFGWLGRFLDWLKRRSQKRVQ